MSLYNFTECNVNMVAAVSLKHYLYDKLCSRVFYSPRSIPTHLIICSSTVCRTPRAPFTWITLRSKPNHLVRKTTACCLPLCAAVMNLTISPLLLGGDAAGLLMADEICHFKNQYYFRKFCDNFLGYCAVWGSPLCWYPVALSPMSCFEFVPDCQLDKEINEYYLLIYTQ